MELPPNFYRRSMTMFACCMPVLVYWRAIGGLAADTVVLLALYWREIGLQFTENTYLVDFRYFWFTS